MNTLSKFSLIIFILAVCGTAGAQQVPISVTGQVEKKGVDFPIFSYGGKVVNSSEFLRVFNKNKRDEAAPTQEEIEEYLELYIKFKLKVAEAYDRQMDTVPAFQNELAGYRTQLAQPYLTDKTVTERLVREAFDRSQLEVRASHLLINCALDAKPIDTAKAYARIMSLRKKIVEGKESFASVAKASSQDPSAKENEGDLGYFTAFGMIYKFENAAFSTPVGDVSMPIRTQFGYHLVYVQDKRKSMGDIKVAHIMVKYYNPDQLDSTKQRVDAVYAKLKDGADWDKTVEEFSDDFNTNSKGGELTWFNRTTGNIPSEFKDIAYTLKKDGDFSEPIKTKFGWHIIKRLETKELPTYDEQKDFLKRRVERDSRSELNKAVVVARVKVENGFKEVGGLAAVKDSMGAELLQGEFKTPKTTPGIVVCKIGNREYTDAYFYAYVATNQSKSNKSLGNAQIDIYDRFIAQINLDYEQGILEDKYDDFRYIMQEYKDGILLFELTDKEVWSKAVKDTVGLEKYYADNESKYMWSERVDATIYSCKNAKVAKKARKMAKKGKTTAEILEKMNADDALAVKAEEKKYEKGTSDLLDKVTWQKGIYSLGAENDRVKFVRINEVLAPSVKPLEQNMGQVTSDYQNYLEQEWLKSLRIKYPVEVYEGNVQELY